MNAKPTHRHIPNPPRLAAWARLWLACIATLLTCADHLLPPAHRRRLPVLNVARTVLAGYVARLILLCAIEHATPTARRNARQAGELRAALRAGIRRHLKNSNGQLDLAQIAHTCANPDAAIADMIAALERPLTRRTPILPRAACDALIAPALIAQAALCDTS